MYAGCYLYGVKLLHEPVGKSLEAVGIFLGPPFCQIAVFVKLSAAVVETVSHLMSDHHSDRTVVHGVVGFRVEIWRLEYGGRKTYFVGSGVVVGIDGLGRHMPFFFVYRLVPL